MITGATQLLGVIGHPVEHSLSPIMHNAAIAQLGVNYVYLPFPIEPDQLETAIAGFSAIGLRGFNITLPHKQAIIPLLTEVSEAAQAVGAVNTVWRTDAGWSGCNTDVTGFLAPLKSMDRDWSQTIVLVLGNGGAARAVVAGCSQLGCAAIWVVGRNQAKLEAFQQSWLASPLQPKLSVHLWDTLSERIPQAGLIVNTTPIGMHPHIDASPLGPSLLAQMQPAAIAYDLIYTPNPTQFLRQADAQGAIPIDGLEMLVRQGAAALEIWLQRSAPVDIMRRSLKQQLGLDS
ncbi:MAG: shikimate dehydrogenase [Leptolyngbyaceae cyanobacterium MO_188.B28]|nr:shikimate dehydrogenase [Leptolyngbyaceae cyanobacterium MO_188.B28]